MFAAFDQMGEDLRVRHVGVELLVDTFVEIHRQDRAANFDFRTFLQPEKTHLYVKLVHPRAVGFVRDAVRGFHFDHVKA